MKVYGNGSFEKRGKESYRFTVVVGYQRKEGGKSKPIKKQKTVRAHGDREARRLLNQWIEELESTESSCDGRSVTLEEYLNKHIRDCEVKGLSERTTDGYRQIAMQRINPVLGSTPLSDLDPGKLTDFYRNLKLHGNVNGGPLSVGTVKKTSALINYALNRAVAEGLIDRNPNHRAENFVSSRDAGKKAKQVALSVEDMHKIINYASIHPNHGLATAIMIGSFTGMRRAEICGLRWGNVDFDNRIIQIENDLIAVKKKGEKGKTLKLSPTKTRESERYLPIAKPLEDFLRRELQRQQRENYAFGVPCNQGTPVVRGKFGSWIYPDTITTNFKSFVRELEIDPATSFKSLRSGVASVLAEAGVPVTEISALLGHSDISTSIRYYIKYASKASAAAVDALEKAYEEQPPQTF